MTEQNKTRQTDSSVTDFLNTLNDEEVVSDCLKLIDIMTKVSECEAKMWGPAIIGFDTYHYKYASGREGDAPVIAFSPRKGKITVYIDAHDESRNASLFAKLGKHTTSKVCIYIKRLSDIDLSVLAQIVEKSYVYTKSLSETEHA